jgi:hypothetical protein
LDLDATEAKLKALVHQLPQENLKILRYLIEFLTKVRASTLESHKDRILPFFCTDYGPRSREPNGRSKFGYRICAKYFKASI